MNAAPARIAALSLAAAAVHSFLHARSPASQFKVQSRKVAQTGKSSHFAA
jgi:hypothetical protein